MSKKSLINVYKLLLILKLHTDKNHTISQAKLRELLGEEQAKAILGDKGTFTRRLRELADAFNTDETGDVKKEEDWTIVYPGYGKGSKNGQIYFNQPLTYFELSFLLKQIEASAEFTNEEKLSLKTRLTKATSSQFFNADLTDSQAVIIDADKMSISDDLINKIVIIRDNIIRMRMLEFDVKEQDELITIRVTPYKMIKKESNYWMIGNRHAIPRDDAPWNRYTEDLFSYRIDQISNIHTAHTEEVTTIHWTMTKSMMPGLPFYRDGKGIETKARINSKIIEQLSALEKCNYDVKFIHNDVIRNDT